MKVVKTTMDPYLQEAALVALGEIGDVRSVPLLVEVAAKGGYIKARLAAVEALARFPDSALARDCLERLAAQATAVGRRARQLVGLAPFSGEE